MLVSGFLVLYIPDFKGFPDFLYIWTLKGCWDFCTCRTFKARSTKRIRKNIWDAKENVKNIKNPYEPLTTLPLQDTQSTIMQSYSRNDYIHPLPSVLQSIQTSIDSSYILSPTNLPISFPSTVPYYSNSTVPSNNCPPDQNPYSLSPAYLFNSSSFSTSHNSSITASSTLNFSS
ncbi:unnamed protein product [Rhizophagus irregularis]|nr:unnamed protein product [Rhizophagus irregularis]CAB5372117.1 unnamed protein product [Rhizophagus irregularis]